ncbi:hypothetical protein OEW28_02860 [Defluviimonas sp. WL0002]|uniref:DUF1845 domain-containing protein n=1 Tax=Albidovulum marisflavi TaxID=2984159 RepID=A0ABT2Z973_9RHOB|nr:hypothetical protein [Defluviimonas sp. WL0002]MCV2867565.1 hypothetical protein [Defluviimonas sp. WL0002]
MTDDEKQNGANLPVQDEREIPSVAFKLEGKNLEIAISGDYSRIKAGAGSRHVSTGVLQQLTNLGSHGKRFDEEATNFALGFVDSMQPRDAAEMLILAQMAATHQAVMMFARRLNHVETITQQDAAERAYNKLLRSYAAQMDTLKRYRSKGQQVVRVERVTVENGGQAVVGNVQHGGRATDER